VVAKGGNPWARLVPLEAATPKRQPGVLTGQLNVPPAEILLEALPEDELLALERSLP